MQKGKQNLRPQLWKPGQSGNPKGRPKKERFIPDILEKISHEKLSPLILAQIEKIFPEAKNMTMLEAMLRIVYVAAITGKKLTDMSAVNYISERMEGKPREQQGEVDLGEVAAAIRENYGNQ